jgi:hypothetical protein
MVRNGLDAISVIQMKREVLYAVMAKKGLISTNFGEKLLSKTK